MNSVLMSIFWAKKNNACLGQLSAQPTFICNQFKSPKISVQRKNSVIVAAVGMNRKFGGSHPAGTPSLAWSCVVVIVSLLAGASVVHNIYKPDLTLPPLEKDDKKEAEKP